MPSAKFVISHEIDESFRNKKVLGMFDISSKKLEKEFDYDLPIEDFSWNIGLILGGSGTGKTTLTKKIFSENLIFNGFDWDDRSIIDNFEQHLSTEEIIESLSKVGFSSAPCWLKPFSILSNGEKMRAELARLMLKNQDIVIYDEFTSLVDRDIAKVASFAISKFIKKTNKKFIGVTCHHDVVDYINPDWVLNLDNKKFYRGSLRRKEFNFGVRKAKHQEWRIFKDYHYLSKDHNKSAHCYIAEINHKPIGWCSVIHFPHPIVKNFKRIHRIVVLPEYQGIGLGMRFLNIICSMYGNYRIRLITSAPTLIHCLSASKFWSMTRPVKRSKKSNSNYRGLKESISTNRLTACFEYKI